MCICTGNFSCDSGCSVCCCSSIDTRGSLRPLIEWRERRPDARARELRRSHWGHRRIPAAWSTSRRSDDVASPSGYLLLRITFTRRYPHGLERHARAPLPWSWHLPIRSAADEWLERTLLPLLDVRADWASSGRRVKWAAGRIGTLSTRRPR